MIRMLDYQFGLTIRSLPTTSVISQVPDYPPFRRASKYDASEREGEQYGTYYQAVRSYREQGKVKQDVVHLGEHQTADEALTAWEREIEELVRTRPKQARKLQTKLERLRELRGVEQG